MQTADERKNFVGFSSLCQTHPEIYLEYLRTVKHVASASLSRGFLFGARGSDFDARGLAGGAPDASGLECRGRAGGGWRDAERTFRVPRSGGATGVVHARGAARCVSTGPATSQVGIARDVGRVAYSDSGLDFVGERDFRDDEYGRSDGVVRGNARSGGDVAVRVGGSGSATRVDRWRSRVAVEGICFGDAPWVDVGGGTAARNRKWKSARKARRAAKVAPSGAKNQELKDTYVERRIAENKLATSRALRALARVEKRSDDNESKKEQSGGSLEQSSNPAPVVGDVTLGTCGAGENEENQVPDDTWSEASFDSRVDDATLPYVGCPERVSKRTLERSDSCRVPGQFPSGEVSESVSVAQPAYGTVAPNIGSDGVEQQGGGPRVKFKKNEGKVVEKKKKTEKDIAWDRHFDERAEKFAEEMREWAARVNAPRPEEPPPAQVSRADATLYERVSDYVWSTEWGKRRIKQREDYERVYGPTRELKKKQAAEAEAARLAGRTYVPSFLEPQVWG